MAATQMKHLQDNANSELNVTCSDEAEDITLEPVPDSGEFKTADNNDIDADSLEGDSDNQDVKPNCEVGPFKNNCEKTAEILDDKNKPSSEGLTGTDALFEGQSNGTSKVKDTDVTNTEDTGSESSSNFSIENQNDPKEIKPSSKLPIKRIAKQIKRPPQNNPAVKESQKGCRMLAKGKTVDMTRPRKSLTQNNEEFRKLVRSDSAISGISNIGIDGRNVRETVTSRLRFEKRHVSHAHEQADVEEEDYLTPTQRKDQTLKDLRNQIKDLTFVIEQREKTISRLKENIDKESQAIIAEKDAEIKTIDDSLESLKNEHEKLRESYQESLVTIVGLEDTVFEYKDKMEAQNKRNEQIYLEMYKKGQESAQFERNVELERLAANAEGSSMTMNELIRKLVHTEAELAKWQSLRRQESYETAEKPETQADCTLRFLRDSFFHYLTDVKDSDRHIRAMIRIFGFTDVQKKKISAALADKKNKHS